MKTIHSNKLKIIPAIFQERCPHCGEGHVYDNKKWYQLPAMKESCESCGYRFDREPGYFIGAMYISYGLAVFEGIITFLICHFAFPNLETIWKPVAVVGVILLLGRKNFKLSRVVYMHIFPW